MRHIEMNVEIVQEKEGDLVLDSESESESDDDDEIVIVDSDKVRTDGFIVDMDVDR